MAENPRFNNSGMFTNSGDNYSDIEPNSTSEVLATQGNVINSIKVFWNKLRAKLAYAISRPNTENAVGSHYQPVYIDEHGVVQVCAPETIVATIESGSNINIGNIPIHPGKTICVQLHGSLSASALPLKIGTAPIIYPSGAPVYSTNVNIEGTYLLTYMAGMGNKWILISSMNVVDGANNGLMTVAEHNKLHGIQEGANNYSLPAATDSSLGGVQLGYNENGKNYQVRKDGNNNLYVNVPWTDTDTDTHYRTKLTVADSDTASTSGSASNGYVHLNLFDDSTKRNSILLKGSGRTTVTSVLENEEPVITVDTNVTLPTVLNRNSTSPTLYSVKGPTSAEKTVNHFLRADGTWSTVSASMGRMSASISNGALNNGSNLVATLKVTYNGSPIQFAFIHSSYKVSSSDGSLSINGDVKTSSAITNETTAVIVPMGNLSLKPQVLHFITKDSVELLD